MASHSRNLMQGERRGRQEQEVVLASNDNSVSTEGHGLDNSNDENRQSRPSPPDSAVTAFGFSNSGLQVGNTYGSVQISSGATVYLGNVSGDHFKSFFGSLSSEHEGPNETERSLLERKQHFQSGRKVRKHYWRNIRTFTNLKLLAAPNAWASRPLLTLCASPKPQNKIETSSNRSALPIS